MEGIAPAAKNLLGDRFLAMIIYMAPTQLSVAGTMYAKQWQAGQDLGNKTSDFRFRAYELSCAIESYSPSYPYLGRVEHNIDSHIMSIRLRNILSCYLGNAISNCGTDIQVMIC